MARRLPIIGSIRFFGGGGRTPEPRPHYSKEEYLQMLRARVGCGVELLDREAPGWWERVELGALELTSCTGCVMGQLFGHYEQGLACLGVWRRGHEYGFALPSFSSELDSTETWAELTEIWHEIILNRRADQLLREAAFLPLECKVSARSRGLARV